MLFEQVVLLGAGNVGHHLGLRLYKKGIRIVQVFSRDIAKAEVLARQLGASATDNLQHLLPLDNCLYLLAIKDDAIDGVAAQLTYLSSPNRLFAHTSGTVSSQVLGMYLEQVGVFYPLQTFSIDRIPDFSQIPICVFAPQTAALHSLLALGELISEQAHVINDRERSVLHVAAVFVNNFTNHLFSIGQELVESEGLPFDLLRPLIAETVAKVMENDPVVMQTGPAKRSDQGTIMAHLHLLQLYPNYQNLYRLLSHSIEACLAKNQKP